MKREGGEDVDAAVVRELASEASRAPSNKQNKLDISFYHNTFVDGIVI